MKRNRPASRNQPMPRKQSAVARVERATMTTMVANIASPLAEDMLAATALPIVTNAAAGAKLGTDKVPL